MQKSKIEEKNRQLATSGFLNAGTGVPPALGFAGTHFVHPGWLYLWKTATVPSTSLTASGAPRASLVVEITQPSIRRQVQSKGKKVLHTVQCYG